MRVGHFAANCPYRNKQGKLWESCLGAPQHRIRQPWTLCCSDEESLLSEPISECTEGHRSRGGVSRVFSLLPQEEELSCGKGKVNVKALIDMGVSVSLIGEDQFKSLKQQGGLRRPDIEIDQVNGKSMKITGMVKLLVKVGGTTSIHKFYVVLDFSGEMTQGGDWLHQQGSKVKFNSTVLTVNSVEVPLGRDLDRSASVVVDKDIKLLLRTAVSGRGRMVSREGEGVFMVDMAEVILMLANQADWRISEPKKKRAKTKKETLVEPEEMETDKDSGEEEGREISHQPVEI